MRSSSLALVMLSPALALSGCRQDMAEQPKLVANGPAQAFPDGAANRPLVAGTVARGDSPPGRSTAPAVSQALLQRGQERYMIFCSPCHGPDGDGDGRVVERGFPHPHSYHDDRLVRADAQHFLDVIAHGYGLMYSYASRIPSADRWAIVAYIRALQVSHGARIAAAEPKSEPASGTK